MKDLESYLNDHLAGSVSALELIAHWAEVHKGEPVGSFFMEIEREIKADQDTLREVMHTLDVEESKVRKAGAWAAEKVGRARLMIAGDEPDRLGLVLTLEGLIMRVTGKKTAVGWAGRGEIATVKELQLGRATASVSYTHLTLPTNREV